MLVFTFIGCFGLESLTLMLFFGYLTKEIVKVNQEKLLSFRYGINVAEFILGGFFKFARFVGFINKR